MPSPSETVIRGNDGGEVIQASAEEAVGQHGRDRDGDASDRQGNAGDGHKEGGLGQALQADLEPGDQHRHEGPVGHAQGERYVAALDVLTQARPLEQQVRMPPPDDEPLRRQAAHLDRSHEPAAEPFRRRVRHPH